MLLFVESMLWSIIGESGFVVSSVVPSAQALLSLHMPTGKLGSRPHVPAQQWEYEAGGSEEAGRVIEPRNGYSRGHKDISPRGTERKADGLDAPEGSSPGDVMASTQDTTGV